MAIKKKIKAEELEELKAKQLEQNQEDDEVEVTDDAKEQKQLEEVKPKKEQLKQEHNEEVTKKIDEAKKEKQVMTKEIKFTTTPKFESKEDSVFIENKNFIENHYKPLDYDNNKFYRSPAVNLQVLKERGN